MLYGLVTCSMLRWHAQWSGDMLNGLVTCSMVWWHAQWSGDMLGGLVICSVVRWHAQWAGDMLSGLVTCSMVWWHALCWAGMLYAKVGNPGDSLLMSVGCRGEEFLARIIMWFLGWAVRRKNRFCVIFLWQKHFAKASLEACSKPGPCGACGLSERYAARAYCRERGWRSSFIPSHTYVEKWWHTSSKPWKGSYLCLT